MAGTTRTIVIAAGVTVLAGAAGIAGWLSGQGFFERAPEPDFHAGWEWMIRQDVAFDQGQDFDYRTGEVTGGTGLQLPDPTIDLEAENIAETCERYVASLDNQSDTVMFMLLFTEYEAASRVNEKFPAVGAAHDQIEAQLDLELGPIFDEVGEKVANYDELVEARAERRAELWAQQSERIRNQADRVDDMGAEVREAIRSEEGVRAAQQVVVEQCGIVVSEGYEFPSAADLGIELG
ncbi:hypothetical protein [Pseudactinotalea terrae]|uniref:hypothetical protein n=1 Tax=Pseudactinotalea terrae TaxID=1743262 RepID=UPI0012E19F66|nr:hypothetical protein [Pseudactinotalea terrae]